VNINRITSGIEEAKATGGARPLEVDLTVNDLGIQANSRAVAKRAVEVPSQITSTPALQAALTQEESLSLVQFFGSPNESPDEQAQRLSSNTYDFAGGNAGRGVAAAHGRLVDWIG
jgi:hypothetical protein